MSCTCPRCVAACRRIPGLFHPLEALRAIRAGYAVDLMAVGYRIERKRGQGYGERFEGLMPRSDPDFGEPRDPHQRRDSWDANGTCIFLRDDRCRIHSSGFKPEECRAAYICKPEDRARYDRRNPELKAAWDTAVGRIVLDIWRRELENPAPAARARVQARRALA